jgi:hypothetical protein
MSWSIVSLAWPRGLVACASALAAIRVAAAIGSNRGEGMSQRYCKRRTGSIGGFGRRETGQRVEETTLHGHNHESGRLDVVLAGLRKS